MRKFIKKIAAAVLMSAMIFTLPGCSDTSDNSTDDTSKEDDNKKADATKTGFQISDEDQELYDSLFDLGSNIKVSIDISNDELKKIEQDYRTYRRKGTKSPIYRKCDVTFTVNGTDYKYDEVGIRMKGNTSRNSFYNDQKGVYALIHLKLSFDETFDDEQYYGADAKVWDSDEERQERKDRKFASLKGLEMKWNRENDSTYLREAYAFRMYRDMGAYAPNNSIGQCVVNNENWGVFKIYEPVDKIFIERNFDEEDWGGDLYKCSWGAGPADYSTAMTAGINDADNSETYSYDLKTNKKDSDMSTLKDMISTVTRMDLDKESLEKVVDTDEWVKFSAVSYFLGMPDDLRNNYNNHFVYFKGSTGQAVFIAYDCDLCLGISDWNPTRTFMTQTDPFTDIAYGQGNPCSNNLVVSTLTENGLLKDEYTKALNDVADSKWMKFETFEDMYNTLSKTYKDVAMPQRTFENADMERFEFTIDDTYGTNSESNHNMQVKEYLSKMSENYETYRNK